MVCKYHDYDNRWFIILSDHFMRKPWLIIGISFFVTLLIVVTAIFLLYYLPAPSSENTVQNAEISIIAAPSTTPIQKPTWVSSPTPTLTPVVVGESGLQIGGFAQISGTEGEGLRLRAGPGRNYEVRFIGMDSEVFEVIDGPVQADGYIWWKLQAPYDQSRNGWSVEEYLEVVTAEN